MKPDHQASNSEAPESFDLQKLRSFLSRELDRRLGDLEDRIVDRLSETSASPMLTERDVAAIMRCDPRTVRRLEQGGEIPPAIRFGGSKRWRRVDVVRWMAELVKEAL